jgi:hypothetical protein
MTSDVKGMTKVGLDASSENQSLWGGAYTVVSVQEANFLYDAWC